MIAYDEAGNTGANLLDPEQPIFSLASVYLSQEAADELIRSVDDSGEIKFSRLKRSGAGRRKVLEILNSPILSENQFIITAFHKPFMAVTKIVDLLVEPAARQDGIDLYEQGANIAMSNLWFFTMPVFIGRKRFDGILADFVEMIRSPSNELIDQFYQLVYDAYQDLGQDDYAIQLATLLYTRQVAENYKSVWDASSLDPAIPAFVEKSSIWTKRLNDRFKIIHDSSKPLVQDQIILEALMSTTDEQVQIGYDRRKMVFPIKADGIKFHDSSLYPQLQVADVIASSAVYFLRSKIKNDNNAFAKELNDTQVFSGTFLPLWPELKVTPEELGTTENGGIDPNDYVGEYVATKLDKTHHLGKRKVD